MLACMQAAMAAKKAGPSAAEFDVGKTAQTQAAQADAVPSADAHQAQQVSFRPTTAGAAGAIDPPSRAVLGKAVVTTQGSGKDTVSTSQQAMIHQGNVAAVTAQGAGGNLPSTSQQSGAEEAAGRPGSRPTRQRSRAQPYWMTGAAGNSPAGNSPSGQSPAAKRSPAVRKASTSPSDSAAASATETVAVNKAAAPAAAVSNRNVSAATPPSGQKAGAAKGKRAVAAKRQAKASPNKDGAQQPPVKRSKAAQQAEAAQSVSGLPAEAEFAAQPAQDQSTSAQQVMSTLVCGFSVHC